MVSFLKKTRWIVSKIGMRSSFDTASMLLLIIFSSYLFEDHFFHFSTFSKCWKKSFFEFPRIGHFYGFGHQNHSDQVQKMWLSFLVDFEQLFLFFWKKKHFSHFWLNFLMEKNLKNSKRLKMVFDGWFELTIVNLVGIEYLKVNIG